MSEPPGSGHVIKTNTHMIKNNGIVLAVIPGVIAAAALLLSLRSHVDADTLVGFGSVIALAAVAALEYRISVKRVFGR